MERVIILEVQEREIEITTDTPFVIMLRDLMYEGDWQSMKQDFGNKNSIAKIIEDCKYIESHVTLLNETVYEPICFEELLEWLEEKNISARNFVHASLSGLYDLALDYADKDLHDVAFKIIKYILEIDKNYAPAYELLGSLLLEKGEFEQGIKYLDKAIEIDPWLVEAYSSLGEAYYNLGEYLKAASYWEREIEYAPDNKFTYFMLAEAYRKANLYDKVCDILERFLKIDPKSILAIYELAEAYKMAGKMQQFKEMEERILKMRPVYANDVEVWSRVQLRHGNYSAVEEVVSQMLEDTKTKAHLKLLLFLACVKQGKVERAKQLIQEMKDQNLWYLYGKKELFSEFLTEEEMRSCGIS